MATWAIGDVQGCYFELRRLVDAIHFDPERDELWLAGDLVNRGPDSSSVLSWAMDHEDSVHAVLGNHDLYLIARALDAVAPKKRDTLDALLASEVGNELVNWLRRRPLVHRRGAWLMVHAALHPSWLISDVEAEARDLEAVLRGSGARAILQESYRSSPTHWAPELPVRERRLASLAVLTRLRCLDSEGGLTFDYTGTLSDCPQERIPWWRAPHQRPEGLTVVIGHWAALGYHREPGLLATDTGCAWGRHLTAVCLEDGAVMQVASDGSVNRRGR